MMLHQLCCHTQVCFLLRILIANKLCMFIRGVCVCVCTGQAIQARNKPDCSCILHGWSNVLLFFIRSGWLRCQSAATYLLTLQVVCAGITQCFVASQQTHAV